MEPRTNRKPQHPQEIKQITLGKIQQTHQVLKSRFNQVESLSNCLELREIRCSKLDHFNQAQQETNRGADTPRAQGDEGSGQGDCPSHSTDPGAAVQLLHFVSETVGV